MTLKQGNFKFLSVIFSLFFSLSILYAEPMRIMPLGDSITKGTWHFDTRPDSTITGYRSHLWYMLKDAGYEADFVGSQVAGQSVEPALDPNHEGRPAWDSFDIAETVFSMLVQNPSDSILLHIGANDHSVDVSGVDSILNEIARYEIESGLSIKVYVALIINRKEGDPYIPQFNENLKKLIGERIKNGDNLTLVNMFINAGLTYEDYADVTHPNDNGYKKMANIWSQSLLGPDTPGLDAFPYTLVNEYYIVPGSIFINSVASTVEFITEIPDTGITF